MTPLARKMLSPSLWGNLALHHLRRLDSRIFGVHFARYHALLRQIIASTGSQSILDVGCGASSPVRGVADLVARRVGVDGHEPSLIASRGAEIHNEYVVANLLDIEKIFGHASFDCVVLLEVIEHFPRESGLALLEQCERIARRCVLLSTPNGFLPQPPVERNPLQEHVSGWTAEDFRARGYEVIGTAGWKPLRGIWMHPRRPRFLAGRISLLTERWIEKFPNLAAQLLCVKRI
jgi:SAM-dependent methyltransferase